MPQQKSLYSNCLGGGGYCAFMVQTTIVTIMVRMAVANLARIVAMLMYVE